MKVSLLLRPLVTKQRRHLSWFKPRKTEFILLVGYMFQAFNIKTLNLLQDRNIIQ